MATGAPQGGTEPAAGPAAPRRRVAFYLVLSRDPSKAKAAEADLKALQRVLGDPAGSYREDAADLQSRPVLRKLLGRARAKGFDVVCVLTFDALAGSRIRALGIVRELHALGVTVVDAGGAMLNPEDPGLSWVAADEDRRRKRITAALDRKRRRGERTGEIAYGQRLGDDGESLVPDAYEQRVIVQAKRLRSDGLSYREIARTISSRGYRSRAGKPFGHTQIKRLLARASAS